MAPIICHSMIMQPDSKVSQDSFIPVEGPSPILRLLASQVCSISDVRRHEVLDR